MEGESGEQVGGELERTDNVRRLKIGEQLTIGNSVTIYIQMLAAANRMSFLGLTGIGLQPVVSMPISAGSALQYTDSFEV